MCPSFASPSLETDVETLENPYTAEFSPTSCLHLSRMHCPSAGSRASLPPTCQDVHGVHQRAGELLAHVCYPQTIISLSLSKNPITLKLVMLETLYHLPCSHENLNSFLMIFTLSPAPVTVYRALNQYPSRFLTSSMTLISVPLTLSPHP